MVSRVVGLLGLPGGKALAVWLGLALVTGCGLFDESGRWFPEEREYLGECIPAGPGFEGGCWWFLFTPQGRVDFTSGSDIAYRGSYRIRGARVAVRAEHHADLDLRLSADQDTVALPGGGHALRLR